MDLLISISELKQQLSDDTVLHIVNKHFISLQTDEVKKNNEHLTKVIGCVISKMKMVNSLFEKTYQKMFFGGSFYKKTKISNPTEFDLNMVIKLPFKEATILPGQPAGFIKLHLPSGFNFTNYTPAEQRTLNSFITNDGFLHQGYFRSWIEGTITRAIQQLPQIIMIKSGPAFTLRLKTDDEVTIDVDLVPVLQFDKELPDVCVQKNRLAKCDSKTWLAVPKPLPSAVYNDLHALYWRLSFYEQEKQILTHCGRTKLLIRLMKKLRDTQCWYSLKSYYIETLFLHELETMEADFNKKPLTTLFYMMLHKLISACDSEQINFYWNENCNLLGNMNRGTIFDIKNRLCRIVKDIERSIEDNKCIIAKYILNPTEYIQLNDYLTAPQPEARNNAANEQRSCRFL